MQVVNNADPTFGQPHWYKNFLAEIRRHDYKPDFQITLDLKPDMHGTYMVRGILDGPAFEVKTRMPNHVLSARFIDGYLLDHLDPSLIPAAVRDFLERLIRQWEDHERDEWFKYDGVCVRDPHPELHALPGDTIKVLA